MRLLDVGRSLAGYLKLAALVQYLPLPVVGGYLAFIGLYCLEAGLSLMSGEQVPHDRVHCTASMRMSFLHAYAVRVPCSARRPGVE